MAAECGGNSWVGAERRDGSRLRRDTRPRLAKAIPGVPSRPVSSAEVHPHGAAHQRSRGSPPLSLPLLEEALGQHLTFLWVTAFLPRKPVQELPGNAAPHPDTLGTTRGIRCSRVSIPRRRAAASPRLLSPPWRWEPSPSPGSPVPLPPELLVPASPFHVVDGSLNLLSPCCLRRLSQVLCGVHHYPREAALWETRAAPWVCFQYRKQVAPGLAHLPCHCSRSGEGSR